MWNGLFKFFASLKLAVFSLLLLSAVLAYATVMGSYYGMRGSQILVYQRWWFAGVLLLLGINVLCAALIRYPWKLRQTGFVVTHLGIIVILIGSFVTQQFGMDGNMPIPEGKQSSEVILNELQLTLKDQKSGKTKSFSVPESAKTKEGKILRIELGPEQVLTVEKFIPRAISETKFIKSPVEGLGNPALKLSLSNSRFQVEEWLKIDSKNTKPQLNLGPALVHFQKLDSPDSEKQFLKGSLKSLAAPKKDKGRLLVEKDGNRFALKVDDLLGNWRKVPQMGVEIKVVRYLPYAVVEKNKLISKSQEPKNPALEILVRDIENNKREEKHTVFSLFPEFNTQHKKAETTDSQSLNVKFNFQGPTEFENLMGVGKLRGQLYLAQSADNQRLLYRVLSSQGKVNTEGFLEVGKKIPTGWMDIDLEVKSWLPSAVMDEEPRSVEELQGADEPFLTAIRVRYNEEPAFWLIEGMGKAYSTGERDMILTYHRDRVFLPFNLYLEKFTMGTNPGTNTAASFVSEVLVKDPQLESEQKAVISMNEPLKHGGYYFYQASYQLSPNQPAVSVFAVNHDPGRALKYLGSLLMTLGIGLMFYMNPQYLKSLFGARHKESSS